MKMKTLERGLLWGLVIYTVVSLILTPFRSIKEAVVDVLPWIGIGVMVTEVLFIGGLLIMATSVGLKTRNPLSLRKELKNILRASTQTRVFWVGFWINATGACGSSLLLMIGVFVAFPVAGWGVACALLIDLVVTIVVRKRALEVQTRERALS